MTWEDCVNAGEVNCPGVCEDCPNWDTGVSQESPDIVGVWSACESCGRVMNPAQAMLGPVCGDCVRAAHAEATS